MRSPTGVELTKQPIGALCQSELTVEKIHFAPPLTWAFVSYGANLARRKTAVQSLLELPLFHVVIGPSFGSLIQGYCSPYFLMIWGSPLPPIYSSASNSTRGQVELVKLVP